MPVFYIRSPGKDPVKYEMSGDEVTFGRRSENSVTLAGDSKISRTHCRVRKVGNGCVLNDAGSANGTRLNGRAIGKGTEPLSSGDTIKIGSTEIKFDDSGNPRPTWFSRLKETLMGPSPAGKGSKPADATSRTVSDGTVFGDGFVKCGKCGAKIHTGTKSPGQKVGCSRCRSVHVIPARTSPTSRRGS